MDLGTRKIKKFKNVLCVPSLRQIANLDDNHVQMSLFSHAYQYHQPHICDFLHPNLVLLLLENFHHIKYNIINTILIHLWIEPDSTL